MKIIYSDQSAKNAKRIFLTGPSLRGTGISWRKEALKILEDLKFNGIVFVPERENHEAKFSYFDQVEWEYECLEMSDLIIFWVPRNLETLPGFTTNVEFGRYVGSGKVLYGRPYEAPKTRYLDWLYKKLTGKEPIDNLVELLKGAI